MRTRILPALMILGTLSLGTLSLGGCDRFGAPRLDVRTFNLEHRAGYEAAELIEPYVFSDRAENPGTMSATETALTVRETRDNLDKIARVLEEFDAPIPALRLKFQLIAADSFKDEDPAISDVVGELRSLFRFEGYRLLGEATVPVTGGTSGAQHFSQRFLGTQVAMTIEAAVRVIPTGQIRLDPVELHDPWNQLLATSVNLTPGQTLVLGGTQTTVRMVETQESGSPGNNTVLILTVRAEAQ